MKNLNTGQVRSLISEAYSNWKNIEAQKALRELKENTKYTAELERAMEAGKAVEDAGGWRAGNELIKEFLGAVDAFVAADKKEIANTTAILHTMIDEASEHDNIEAQNALIDVIHDLDDPSTLLAAIEKWDDTIKFGRWRMSEDDVAEYHELLTKHVGEVM